MKWPIAKLGDTVRFVGGGTPSKKNPDYWGGSIPWASVKDFKGPVLDKTVDYITEAGLANSASRLLPAGTVVIPTRMALGKAAITVQPTAINQDLKGVLPVAEISPTYLFHYFEAHSESIERLGEGATVKGITIEKLSRLEIPLPPLDEQKRIAAVLDKADALRSQRQESLQLTEKLLQSVFIDMFGDPAELPKLALSELLTKPLRNGLSPASAGQYSDSVLTLSAITRGAFNSQARKEAMFANRPRPAARVSLTDFLICRGNGNLKLCGKGQFPTDDAAGVIFPDTIIAASIDQSRVAKTYFETLWNQPYVRRQIESGARTANGIHKVNQTTLNEIMIPLPALNDQLEFERVVSSIVPVVGDFERSADEAEKLFSSLQQRAFRGELDLNRLELVMDSNTPDITPTQAPALPQGRYNRPGSFSAPPAIEPQMLALEEQLDSGAGDSIPWDENYFKYRILSQVLQPPFSFAQIWEAVEHDIEEPDYETVKEKVFEYVRDGILRQRFCKKSKEIVFFPNRK